MTIRKQLERMVELKAKLTDIETDLYARIRGLWPVGSYVQFMLRHGQKTPTTGRVVGHCAEHLTVTLPTTNRRGNNTVKRVLWSNIFT